MINQHKDIVGIIDGDILIYRACHKALNDNLEVTSTFDELYEDLQDQMACSIYSLHVSGPGNFRKHLKQGFTKYKGKRKEKPANYRFLRDYIFKKYDCISVPLYEADDTASIEATKYIKSGQLFMMATIDKDWTTIGGIIYNTQYKSLKAISKIDAITYFHKQLLTGDSVDNIPGIYGVGNKKAEKILNNKNIKDQFKSVIDSYKEYYPDDYRQRLNVMGKLLYLIKDYNDPAWSITYWNRYLKNASK